MALSTATRQAVLARLGFRVNTSARYKQAVYDFQRGYSFGRTGLAVDGIPGPQTDAALNYSYARARAGLPTASAHFSFSEFQCKCGGRYSTCRRIWVERLLILRLEAYRARIGGPVRIVSGSRCTSHNRAVGGVSNSQHLGGKACDIEGLRSLATMRSYRLFTGMGYKGSTGRVIHVDVRSGPSTSSPTTWRYAT